jgi:2-polyprenyl-3-methyl-5-hydroxy-6-metoxy-1,4-benzoquinol methylase
MTFHPQRRLQPEWLDELPLEEKQASLRDLTRINRLLGGHAALRRSLARMYPPTEAFTLLDVGAATGDTARALRSWYPRSQVVSLDYRPEHLLTTPAPKLCADAFRLPFRPATFDVVHCALFLHHFSAPDILQLLTEFSRIARSWLLVNDLERHPLPYYFLPLTRWLFHWDPVTLHDGPISVQAGFTPAELLELARQAGLGPSHVHVYRPAFRLVLCAKPRSQPF